MGGSLLADPGLRGALRMSDAQRGLVSSGIQALAQTLPILEVPTIKSDPTSKRPSTQAWNSSGGLVSGDLPEVLTFPVEVGEDQRRGVISFMTTFLNDTDLGSVNLSLPGYLEGNRTASWVSSSDKDFWALILLLFPVFTVFGNVLVILSVYKERSLQTVTNYFIVSLAVADLLVAAIVMPFAVYYLVNKIWGLPTFVCDCYMAMDVICSTSSIFNLVAISIDRFIAVTKPIKYAHHKNSKRIVLTIAVVWLVSIAIGVPMILGLNQSPRTQGSSEDCVFNNPTFIICSSLFSFYIPCLIMIYLYYKIFAALRKRAIKAAHKKSREVSQTASRLNESTVIENVAQTKKLPEVTTVRLGQPLSNIEDEKSTNNTSNNSQDEDEEEVPLASADDSCQVIRNPKPQEFRLSPLNEGIPKGTDATMVESSQTRRNGVKDCSCQAEETPVAVQKKHKVRKNGPLEVSIQNREESGKEASETGGLLRKKEQKASGARFTIYKVNKASKKKREKSSAKKERKATKTLAIVLGVFLFCWVPFFTCNIIDAFAKILDNEDMSPGMTAFLLTTWLGYINSFINPVIYTIFNPEFRKAFKKILAGTS